MAVARRKLVLTTLLSAPPFTWRYSEAGTDGFLNLDYYIRLAQTAERGCLDAVFMADSFGVKDDGSSLEALKGSGSVVSFEPLTLLSALAMHTRHVGLAATISTTYTVPFNVARQVGSLDHLSKGRAGWNVITSTYDAEARNYSLTRQMTSAERYSRAMEFVDVVFDLWDSWEDDAFIRNRASGQFYDPAKVHRLNHVGPNFSVRGPLNMPRPPQGRPVIFQAGTSDAGYEMAARTADAMYVKTPTLEMGKAFYRDIKSRMRRYGRAPEALAILPGLCVVVGKTEAEAHARFNAVVASLKVDEGLAYLRGFIVGIDFSGMKLDEKMPDTPEINRSAEAARIFLNRDGRRLTLRETMQYVATMVGHLTFFGTPAQIADSMALWVQEEACDGFNLMPYYLPGNLEEFVDLVVPELQKRGMFRTEYAGATLRENLGVPRPANRFTARAMEQPAKIA